MYREGRRPIGASTASLRAKSRLSTATSPAQQIYLFRQGYLKPGTRPAQEMKATSYQLNSSDPPRQVRLRSVPLPPSTEPRGPVSLRVLTARRLLDLFALGVAPAAAGGLVAFAHTGHPAWGAIVAVSILA